MFGDMNDRQRLRAEYAKQKYGYYHLATDGWQQGRLFHTLAQYAYGMVLIGLLTLRFPIVIYDFTLMNNHIHILLKGNGKACLMAFDYLKRKLSARLAKDGYPPLPKDYGFKLTAIVNEKQMRTNYLYVARNSYERKDAIPGCYPWGADYLHYSPLSQFIRGKRADTLSKRELERLTGSRTPIPSHWEFHPELGLLPASFVEEKLFKRLFHSPKDYQTHLIKDYEAFVQVGKTLCEDVTFSKEEVDNIVDQLIKQYYPQKRIQKLSNDEKGRLCVLLSENYGLQPEMIASELILSVHLVNQFLHAKDYGVTQKRPKTRNENH